MSDAEKRLYEIFVKIGLAARLEAQGKEHATLAIAQNMVDRGYPIEDIVSVTKLDPDKAKELYTAMCDSAH